MRRLVGIMLAAALAVYAATLPEAPVAAGPDFVGPEPPAVGASSIGSVWYCPWLDSGDVRDSAFVLASQPPTDSQITMPSPIPNNDPIEEFLAIRGPGSRILNVADVVRFGAAPGFVEFDDGPAAAAATVMSETSLAGDRCVRSVPKIWYLAGGTTREGRDVLLRLFNPFPDLAKVTVSGVSEFGPEPLPELGSVVDVPGRAWVDIDLGLLAPFLDDLLLIVDSQEGLIVPALLLVTSASDEATWPGTSLSTTWEFPIAAMDDLLAQLVVANPGAEAVTVTVDLIGPERTQQVIGGVEAPAGSPLRLALPDTEGEPFGIRVTAGGPIAAAVVAESPVDPSAPTDAVPDAGDDAAADDAVVEQEVLRVAGTVGVEAPSPAWLLPGAGSVPDAESTIWLMNSGPEPATVTLVPLGVRDLPADKVVVSAGRIFGYTIPDDEVITGYLVVANVPVSAAWAASDAGGTAFVIGVPIGA
jgi:hypothetical protein